MKNKLLLTLISIFIQLNVNAQSSPLWTQTMNTLPDSSNLLPVKTEVDIFGNVVTLSYKSDTPERNIFLRKFNTDGNVLWTQIFDIPGILDPRGFDLAVDSSANIYVAGGVYSTIETPLLLKFNSSGNLVWRRDSATAIPYFSFHQIILKNSLLYVKGEGGIAVFDLFGNEQWSVSTPCNYIAVDNLGRVVASIIAGAANNQLANEAVHGKILKEKGILYAPDFLINAGGVINVYSELVKWTNAQVMEKTENIYNTALEIFKFADDNNITTHQAAFSMAQKRIDDAKNELKK